MFRSSTIIRELALNLDKFIFMLKHSVELRRYLLCGCVAACHGMACVACCAECDCRSSGHAVAVYTLLVLQSLLIILK